MADGDNSHSKVISRDHAKALGFKRYFTGVPCKRGHISERYVLGGDCLECGRCQKRRNIDTRRKYIAKTLERHRSYWRKAAGLPEPTRPRPDRCECCGAHQSEKKKVFSLDHCHSTGKFRGWLCDQCNHAIGFLGDSLEGVMRAVRYLRSNE